MIIDRVYLCRISKDFEGYDEYGEIEYDYDVIKKKSFENLERSYYRKKLLKAVGSNKLKTLLNPTVIGNFNKEVLFNDNAFIELINNYAVKLASIPIVSNSRNILGYRYHDDLGKNCVAILIEDDKSAISVEDDLLFREFEIVGKENTLANEVIILNYDDQTVKVIEGKYTLDGEKQLYLADRVFRTHCAPTFEEEFEEIATILSSFLSKYTHLGQMYVCCEILRMVRVDGVLNWNKLITNCLKLFELEAAFDLVIKDAFYREEDIVLTESQMKSLEKSKLETADGIKLEINNEYVRLNEELLEKIENLF